MSDYSSYDNNEITKAVKQSYQKTDFTRFCYVVPADWQVSPVNPELKVNYVIATWSGKRRKGNEVLTSNPAAFIEKHLAQLQNLKHKLDQITIMVPENPKEPEKFTQYLENISNVSVIRRPNEGQSYGSYADCYKIYRNHFDYYIFVEDDYIPVQNNFDDILVSMFESCKNCGFLCSKVDKYPPTNYYGRPHAAISNGITRADILETILNKYEGIPCGRDATKLHKYAATPQLEFSWAFLDIGKWLYDYSSHYSSPYHHIGKIQHYGDVRKPALFVPFQSFKVH